MECFRSLDPNRFRCSRPKFPCFPACWSLPCPAVQARPLVRPSLVPSPCSDSLPAPATALRAAPALWPATPAGPPLPEPPPEFPASVDDSFVSYNLLLLLNFFVRGHTRNFGTASAMVPAIRRRPS